MWRVRTKSSGGWDWVCIQGPGPPAPAGLGCVHFLSLRSTGGSVGTVWLTLPCRKWDCGVLVKDCAVWQGLSPLPPSPSPGSWTGGQTSPHLGIIQLRQREGEAVAPPSSTGSPWPQSQGSIAQAGVAEAWWSTQASGRRAEGVLHGHFQPTSRKLCQSHCTWERGVESWPTEMLGTGSGLWLRRLCFSPKWD